MNIILPLIEYSCEPLVRASKALAPVLANICHWQIQKAYTVADFAVSVGLVGFACVYWACWMHARLGNFRLKARYEKSRDGAIINFQGLLMDQNREAIAILSSANRDAQYFGEAEFLFEACKQAPDAEILASDLNALKINGTSFTFTSQLPDKSEVEIRGLPLGGRAVLYLRKKDQAARDLREVLDSLPLPIWLRDSDMALGWANRAFLAAVGVEKIAAAQAAHASLDLQEGEWAAAAWKDHAEVETTLPVILHGQRKSLKLNLIPLRDGVAGVAVDVTEATELKASLQLLADVHDDLMEQIPLAMAVFDAEQRIVRCNSAYAQLWSLPESWLDEHPTLERILDRLRESRKLPEQRNFNAWKQAQMQIFAQADHRIEEFWHPPGGKSLRVLIQPHLQGGVFVLFEDVSERFRLEESLAMLTQVQRATLDSLDAGIAIFGPDGRLVLHNDVFAKMWLLTEQELSGQPHFAEIATICSQRIGRDGIWGIVSCGVNSAQPERLGEWGKAVRADGRTISLALSRLPNGATSVTFSDLTDVERFSTFQNAGSNVAA